MTFLFDLNKEIKAPLCLHEIWLDCLNRFTNSERAWTLTSFLTARSSLLSSITSLMNLPNSCGNSVLTKSAKRLDDSPKLFNQTLLGRTPGLLSGRYFHMSVFCFAKANTFFTLNPDIFGTLITVTLLHLTYYTLVVLANKAYPFITKKYRSDIIMVCFLYRRKVSIPFSRENVIHFALTLRLCSAFINGQHPK